MLLAQISKYWWGKRFRDQVTARIVTTDWYFIGILISRHVEIPINWSLKIDFSPFMEKKINAYPKDLLTTEKR